MFEIGNLCSKSGDFEISYAKTGRCGPLAQNSGMTTITLRRFAPRVNYGQSEPSFAYVYDTCTSGNGRTPGIPQLALWLALARAHA